MLLIMLVKIIAKTKFWWVYKILNRLKIPVYDVWFRNEDIPAQKRALLSYIVSPLRSNHLEIPLNNFGICVSIVKALNNLGFIVDVIDYTSSDFIPNRKYDLCIYHGGMNIRKVLSILRKETKIIYFSTGAYWKVHNEKEKERLNKLANRQGVLLQPDRKIAHDEDVALKEADGIIALGNHFLGETYSMYSNVYLINNANFQTLKEITPVETGSRKKNFLFFAGGGNVHKGLDLVIEAFVKVDANLFICTKIEKDFYSLYANTIENNKNINNIGWVTINSQVFLEMVEKCAYIISPSCSEGQPSSVITCMSY
jgi:glycosyltransferase involved in cell wall biosynthesis